MPYLAAAVANEFFDRAGQSGRRLTQIDIQKLVYFAHGWHLGLKGEPLIVETVEAWQYGPVVRSLYHHFRRFGSKPVTEKAVESMNLFGRVADTAPRMSGGAVDGDQYARSLVGAVWQKYGSLPPFKLVELTHASGSPWALARSEGKLFISNESIETYFKGFTTAAA